MYSAKIYKIMLISLFVSSSSTGAHNIYINSVSCYHLSVLMSSGGVSIWNVMSFFVININGV